MSRSNMGSISGHIALFWWLWIPLAIRIDTNHVHTATICLFVNIRVFQLVKQMPPVNYTRIWWLPRSNMKCVIMQINIYNGMIGEQSTRGNNGFIAKWRLSLQKWINHERTYQFIKRRIKMWKHPYWKELQS